MTPPVAIVIHGGAGTISRDRLDQDIEISYRQIPREEQLNRLRIEDRISLSESDGDGKFGTVGAVALDAHGTIAAGTSTGGMTNKRFGRVGDSPIIGAGTYADDLCGISATGHGEYFIRAVVAHDICARVRYQGISLHEAAGAVVHEKLVKMAADGGIIGIDNKGRVVTTFNSSGMYRASIDTEGRLAVGIFSDERE